MIVIVSEDIGSVVVVFVTVSVRIFVREGDTGIISIIGSAPDAVRESQVAETEEETLLQTVLTDESLFSGVVVAVVGLSLAHGLVEFQNVHLQGCKRVAKAGTLVEDHPYLTGVRHDVPFSIFGQDLILCWHRKTFLDVELRHELSLHIGACLWIPDTSKIGVVIPGVNRVDKYGMGIGTEGAGAYLQLICLVRQ